MPQISLHFPSFQTSIPQETRVFGTWRCATDPLYKLRATISTPPPDLRRASREHAAGPTASAEVSENTSVQDHLLKASTLSTPQIQTPHMINPVLEGGFPLSKARSVTRLCDLLRVAISSVPATTTVTNISLMLITLTWTDPFHLYQALTPTEKDQNTLAR